MKVTGIEAFHVTVPLETPYVLSKLYGTIRHAHAVVTKVTTDSGLTGYGEADPMPPFTEESYEWEQNYFIEHLIGTHLGMDGSDLHEAPALVSLRKRLGATHRHLVHRDLQSQNILLHEGKAWLIDFQGMRYGYQEYDLASLLYDPYINHSEEDIERMLDLWEDVTEERPIPALLRDCAAQRMG